MMLEDPENRGCPFDYLLARIRSRRSLPAATREGFPEGAEAAPAMTDGGPAGTPPTGPEAGWIWLWHLMEPKQRGVHAPLFFYHELKPLCRALRRREARRWDESERIMATSLLARPLKRMVVDEGSSTEQALDGIIRLLGKSSKEFSCLRGVYRAGGIRAFEEALLGATLAYTAETALHPGLRAFFDRLSDIFNLLTISRHLRWRSPATPPPVPGGRIAKTTMDAWLRGEDPDRLDAFTASLTKGSTFQIVPAELERELLGGMTRLCRRLAREADGVGLVVEYLWRLSMETRNRGLAADRRGIDRRLLQEEMTT